jgi:hypothetical protein
MKIVLEYSWQEVVDIDFGDEYATKDHVEFAYNQGTHCSTNDVARLVDQIRAAGLWIPDLAAESPDDDMPPVDWCDVIVTRRVREARPDEPVGLIHPFRRWAEEGWD